MAGRLETDSSGLRAAFLPPSPTDDYLQEAHFKQIELQGFTLVQVSHESVAL